MQTIVVANHKGGVGKTTTAVTVATGLAALGHQTVLIDCDVQGHVAHFLGLESRPALYEFVVMERSLAEIGQAVAPPGAAYPHLQVITGDEETLDITRIRRFQPATAMLNAIKTLPATTRFVIIDTAPSVTEIQFSALHAARWLLIPAMPEYASETGIAALANLVEPMQAKGAAVQLLGVLPTMVQTRRQEHRDTIAAWVKQFDKLLLSPVRNLTELAEAPGRGVPIWDYAPNSEAVKDYAKALISIKKRIGLTNGKK